MAFARDNNKRPVLTAENAEIAKERFESYDLPQNAHKTRKSRTFRNDFL